MTQRVSLSIEQWIALREGGASAPPIWFTVVGGSMFPLIRAHRDRVLERMAEMQQHLDKVNWKLNFFSEKLRDYEARKAGK